MTALLVYPCNHVFHRQCIRVYINEYETRNPQFQGPVKFIQETYREIDRIRSGLNKNESTGLPEATETITNSSTANTTTSTANTGRSHTMLADTRTEEQKTSGSFLGGLRNIFKNKDEQTAKKL